MGNITTKNEHIIPSKNLVELKGYHLFLQYDVGNYEGSSQKAYLHELALEKLNIAREVLEAASTLENRYELLIWDAYRTKQTQRDIYNRYVQDISAQEGISFEEAYPRALAFVNSPDGVFPHGTGGTVDLTLLVNGVPANMGTGFDEFVQQSHKDWYRKNLPVNDFERDVHKNRELLRGAMEQAGFYGLDLEWWHYEWGTKLWAEITGQKATLDKTIVDHGVQPHLPAYKHQNSDRLPVLYSGVAQLFHSSRDRSAALFGSGDHYYSRKSHPTVEGFGKFLSQTIIKADYISLVSSGFNAAKTALISAMGSSGTLIFDRRSYYEIGNEVAILAVEFGWHVEYADFTDIEAVERLLVSIKSSGSPVILYFDSPMNWWLDTVDLEAIGRLKKKYELIVLADITLDPIQTDILSRIDIAVMSLSKYPSTGFTLGGAIYTNSGSLYSSIEATIGRFGSRMTMDAAMTIWSQAVTLIDRYSALSAKSSMISSELNGNALIHQVRVVGSDEQKIKGGVIVLEFKSKAYAATFEKIIAQNTMNKFSNLNLAYTFGGVVTTVEHFHSNPRPLKLNPELNPVPDEFVRIGLGYEKVDDLLLELKAALSYAESWSALL